MVQQPRIIGLIAIILIATAGTGAVIVLNKKVTTSSNTTVSSSQSTPATPATTQSTTTSSTPTTSATTSTAYKDGTYSATGNYDTPDGQQTIDITLTVKSDTVTAVSASGNAQGESSQYQDQFINGYKQYVVGKAIAEISLSRVSGSSLTTQGFNNALQSIKTKARV